MTICRTCGQEIRPGEQLTIIPWNEGDERVHRDCTAAAVARATNAEAEVKQLTADRKTLQTSLTAAQNQLASQAAWIDRAREVIRHIDLSALGVRSENVVIEHLIPVADEKE